MSTTDLARFVDRWTMEHVRVYPHPVERVWRAITLPEHIACWFGEAEIDLRIGGAARFGSAAEPYFTAVVTALEPPTSITFSDRTGTFGYRLTEIDEGCRMVFRQHFDQRDQFDEGCRMVFRQHFDQRDQFDAVPDDPGGDLPAGPDTPWMPGFVGGWHDFFDRLGRVLDRDGRLVAKAADEPADTERWSQLTEIYRQHIRDTIPAA